MTDIEHLTGEDYALAVAGELEDKLSGFYAELVSEVDGEPYNERFCVAVGIPLDAGATLPEIDAECTKAFETEAAAYKATETAATHPTLRCEMLDRIVYQKRHFEREFLFSRKRVPDEFSACKNPGDCSYVNK